MNNVEKMKMRPSNQGVTLEGPEPGYASEYANESHVAPDSVSAAKRSAIDELSAADQRDPAWSSAARRSASRALRLAVSMASICSIRARWSSVSNAMQRARSCC